MTELLASAASSGWAYLVLLSLLAVDAFVPVIPTQAVMITGGALTVYGHLSLPMTIATGAFGVFCGDLACYLIGRRGSRGKSERANLEQKTGRAGQETGPGQAGGRRRGWGVFRASHGALRRSRARRAASRFTRGLRRPGPLSILLCRFLPGGRMAACFHAGRARYPYHLFLIYEATAALSWSAYGTVVGHVGGSALTQSAWRLVAVAAVAAAIFAAAGWLLALRQPAAAVAATVKPVAAPASTVPAQPTPIRALTAPPMRSHAEPAATVSSPSTPTPDCAASAGGPLH